MVPVVIGFSGVSGFWGAWGFSGESIVDALVIGGDGFLGVEFLRLAHVVGFRLSLRAVMRST
jgi:hypothetical protein